MDWALFIYSFSFECFRQSLKSSSMFIAPHLRTLVFIRKDLYFRFVGQGIHLFIIIMKILVSPSAELFKTALLVSIQYGIPLVVSSPLSCEMMTWSLAERQIAWQCVLMARLLLQLTKRAPSSLAFWCCATQTHSKWHCHAACTQKSEHGTQTNENALRQYLVPIVQSPVSANVSLQWTLWRFNQLAVHK